MGMRLIAWTLIAVGSIGWGVHAGTAWAANHAPQAAGSETAASASKRASGTKSAAEQAAFLERAVAATGNKATAALVHDYSQVDGTFQTEAQLKQLAFTAGRALGVQKGKAQERSLQGENFVELTGQGTGKAQAAVFCSSFQGKSGSGTTVLVIRVRPKTAQQGSLHSTLVNVYKAVAADHMKPQVSAYVKTVAPGVDSRTVEQQRARVVLRAVGATPVGNEMKSGPDISMSGYAPNGPHNILTGGKSMNVQVGVHADHLNHQTDVIVGTPIIVDPF